MFAFECCSKLASGAQYPHAIFLACMGNHNTSLSSAIITILLSSELESDTFSKTFQITPLLGFSTNHSGQISALCLSALIDWMSLLPVKSARSSAVSQSLWCQLRAWLEPLD